MFSLLGPHYSIAFLHASMHITIWDLIRSPVGKVKTSPHHGVLECHVVWTLPYHACYYIIVFREMRELQTVCGDTQCHIS